MANGNWTLVPRAGLDREAPVWYGAQFTGQYLSASPQQWIEVDRGYQNYWSGEGIKKAIPGVLGDPRDLPVLSGPVEVGEALFRGPLVLDETPDVDAIPAAHGPDPTEEALARLIIDDAAWELLTRASADGLIEANVLEADLASLADWLALGFLVESNLLAASNIGVTATEAGERALRELTRAA